MNDSVFIKNSKTNYNNSLNFNPSTKYLEGLNLSIKSDQDIYDDIRTLFIEMELDKKNINTKKWNPFSDFIKTGDTVLIKPNLVKHINDGPGSLDSLITNFAILRPVIDYTILALKGTGKIIVGDAPVQECDFKKVKEINDLEKNINKYKKVYSNIELTDFRKNQNPSIICKTVRIDNNSSFSELDKLSKEYSITNYNLSLMNEHHKNGKHEYIIPQDVLNADVIINLPKPKTHRKAGITACMKNFVGINGNKECLPHHRTGGPNKNGDEFPENSIFKNIYSWLSKFTYLNNSIIEFFRKCFLLYLKIIHKDRFKEGSWYGNDTIWRTILDLNKIILYSNKSGNICSKRQRIIFNIADMIISGEGEGPLLPIDKPVGILVAGFNQLNNDNTICQIMGFDPKKIKYIENGYNLTSLEISNQKDFKIFYNGKTTKDISKFNKHFKATDGWKDYLEGDVKQ